MLAGSLLLFPQEGMGGQEFIPAGEDRVCSVGFPLLSMSRLMFDIPTRVTSEGCAPSEQNVPFGEPSALLPGHLQGLQVLPLLVRASDAGTVFLTGTQTHPKGGSPNSGPASDLSSSSPTTLLCGQ